MDPADCKISQSMCAPSAQGKGMSDETTQKRSYTQRSWSPIATIVAVVGFLVALGLPVMISEAIGGWTRKYTSPVQFTTSSIPDMNNKVAIVTGGNTGIGYYTALELARHGADVIVAARSASRGEAAVAKIQEELLAGATQPRSSSSTVQFLQLDLASLDSVERFASEFLLLGKPLHILVLNAGVMKSPGAEFVGKSLTYGFETTQDGFEYHIGVNHIAHAHLTNLLLPKLVESAPSRVVSVSSLAERNSYDVGFVFDQWVPASGQIPETYEDGKAYGQSKLANLMYANELATRMNGTGVSAYAVHPGVIKTELGRYMEPVLEQDMESKGFIVCKLIKLQGQLFQMAMFTAKDGALTQLHVATSPEEELVNGAMIHPIGRFEKAAHVQGLNSTLQKTLWDETQRAIELRNKYRKQAGQH